MKKENKEEPKEYIERSIALVAFVTLSGLCLDALSLILLIDVNPWGALVAVPGLVLTLQGIWLIVNPYAVIYKNRFEIKQSLIHDKEFYYLDARKIESSGTSTVRLVYNDGDTEKLHTLGMRASHKELFTQKLNENITLSLQNRSF